MTHVVVYFKLSLLLMSFSSDKNGCIKVESIAIFLSMNLWMLSNKENLYNNCNIIIEYKNTILMMVNNGKIFNNDKTRYK